MCSRLIASRPEDLENVNNDMSSLLAPVGEQYSPSPSDKLGGRTSNFHGSVR